MTYPPPYEPQPGAQPPTRPVPPTSGPPQTMSYPAHLGPPVAPNKSPKSNGPIIAVVIVLAVLPGGVTVSAGALFVNRGGDDPGRTSADGPQDKETTRVAERTTDPRPDESESESSGNGYGDGAKVVYEVTGDGPVSIVYVKEDGLTPEPATDTDLPWRKELTLAEGANVVTVTAVRTGGGQGTIQCRITIDGKEVAKKKDSGTFATASCSKFIL